MSKIRILPEQLANRIAAGEVVERPASVVKELIENSLDAGANRIEVEIEGGGTRLIRIVDNGEGMDGDDALLCFERHGTSKISDSHDLVAITTLGFRGEAIPSIASVAKMTLVSRPRNMSLGTSVEFAYGRLLKVHETGCSYGTRIDIRDLFGKTPARRKFLRTTKTELSHIEEVMKCYALACPEITFSLQIDGKGSFSVDGSHDFQKRLGHIMHYSGNYIEVGQVFNRSAKRQVHGYLLPPEHAAGGSSKLRLFLNGRAIRDRLMSHATNEGLRGFLLKGHSSAGYIHLRLPAEEVDVNVHPAKHEIRFRNTGDIHQYIKQSVEEAMRDYQHTIRAGVFGRPRLSVQEPGSGVVPREPAAPGAATASAPSGDAHLQEKQADLFGIHQGLGADQQTTSAHTQPITALVETREPAVTTALPPEAMLPRLPEPSIAHPPDLRLRVIGQIKNLYIFCQSADGLVVIDQHAAHERLLYEKFRRQYTTGKVISQTLMFAETVELSPFQIQLVETYQREIEKIGFTISEFGGNSYIISAIPAIAGRCNGSDLFLDTLESFGREGNNRADGGGRLDTIFATMACKAAVKSGDELSPPEIDALLLQMANADLFSHCPHGRPVLKRFSADDMKKWFYRT